MLTLALSSQISTAPADAESIARGGPQFGSPRIRSWHGNLRFVLVVFAVLALSMIWIRGNHSSNLLTSLIQQTSPLQKNDAQNAVTHTDATNTNAPSVTLELNNEGITAEIPSNQIDIITEQAQQGDGITRLARRALTQRLQDESLSLNPEQRVYAEDFAQKATGENKLRINQKLSFPTELLDQAIKRAQQLSPRQLKNLSHYSAHVRF